MKTADFDYELPEYFIAQEPVEPRDSSRLMVIDRASGSIENRVFKDILEYLDPGDCLIVNDTRVIPARLIGEKESTGAKVEIFLLAEIESGTWEALVKPGRRLQPGTRVVLAEGKLRATIEKRLESGGRIVSFEHDGDFNSILDKFGQVPLPPYITHPLEEKERYQTVYSRERGSVAAPTAGLHFTQSLIERIREKGVNINAVTLRVGLDTFRPVREEDVENHKMHSEFYTVPKETADLVNATKKKGGRVIAVGTTSARVLESAGMSGILAAGSNATSIFIYPGYKFNTVDALITNFHLPRSTLLMMVAAFAGYDLIMKAYQEAIQANYRFYSFGDAMFIL